MQSTGKAPIEGDDALRVLDGVHHLRVAKGRKSVDIDLRRDRPSDEELLSLLLGRSGKLRAPSLRVGRTLIVGYSADLLADALL